MECCWKISKITKFCLSLQKFTTFMRIKKNSRGPPAKIDGELQINSWKMLEESVEIKKITKNHNWWESQNFAKTSTKINRDILMVYSRLRPFTKWQKKNYKKIKFWKKPIKLWKLMEKCNAMFVEGSIIIQTIQFLGAKFAWKSPSGGTSLFANQHFVHFISLSNYGHCNNSDNIESVK